MTQLSSHFPFQDAPFSVGEIVWKITRFDPHVGTPRRVWQGVRCRERWGILLSNLNCSHRDVMSFKVDGRRELCAEIVAGTADILTHLIIETIGEEDLALLQETD